MDELPGRWALTMTTPIGRITAEMTFTRTDDGFTGTAVGKAETVPLHDIRVAPADQGLAVTWTQEITRPMRLNLAFDVLIEGDHMRGHSRAGRLPRSTVTGTRITH